MLKPRTFLILLTLATLAWTGLVFSVGYVSRGSFDHAANARILADAAELYRDGKAASDLAEQRETAADRREETARLLIEAMVDPLPQETPAPVQMVERIEL